MAPKKEEEEKKMIKLTFHFIPHSLINFFYGVQQETTAKFGS